MSQYWIAFTFVVFSIVLLPANTESCESGRLLVSTVSEDFPDHQYKGGLYIQEHGTFHNRSFYRNVKHPLEYLFFVPSYIQGMQMGGLWMIGRKNFSESEEIGHGIENYLLVMTTVESPEFILHETWKSYNSAGGTWDPLPLFQIKCITDSEGERCKTNEIYLEGVSRRHREHRKRMGRYEFTGMVYKLRPVYFHQKTEEYLFYTGEMWLIGPELGDLEGSIFAVDNAFRPEYVTHTWRVFHQTYIAEDKGIRATCESRHENKTNPSIAEDDVNETGKSDENGSIPEYEAQIAGQPHINEMPDACHFNYCANDGLCKKNSDGSLVCLCKVGYVGDICEEMVTCGRPPSVSHGQPIVSPNAETFPYLKVIQYSCHAGYHLSSTDSCICDSNGQWTASPSCNKDHNFDLTPGAPFFFKKRQSNNRRVNGMLRQTVAESNDEAVKKSNGRHSRGERRMRSFIYRN